MALGNAGPRKEGMSYEGREEERREETRAGGGKGPVGRLEEGRGAKAGRNTGSVAGKGAGKGEGASSGDPCLSPLRARSSGQTGATQLCEGKCRGSPGAEGDFLVVRAAAS